MALHTISKSTVILSPSFIVIYTIGTHIYKLYIIYIYKYIYLCLCHKKYLCEVTTFNNIIV